MEILITLVVVALAASILFKNIKKSSKGGGCNCGKCSDSCPVKEKNKNTIDLQK